MEEGIITLEQVLNNKNFEKEFEAITINNDIPITLTDADYKTPEGSPLYTNSEKEGRSGVAIAKISPNTLAIYTSKNVKRPEPINWTETISSAKIFQKCHIIGYRLDARINNPHNIFIGTIHLNISSMKTIENDVAIEVQKGKTCIYKVTPMYKFKEDVVPIGVLIEVDAINDSENFHRCRFCYNIQDGYKINYYDGSQEPIESAYKGKSQNIGTLPEITESNQANVEYKDYKINIKTGTVHIFACPCKSLNKVDPKYIQETTGKEKEILKTKINGKKLRLCKRCNNK